MDNVRIDIAGDRQVGLKFEEFPDNLYEDLRKEIEGLSAELLGMVQAATPTATGKLRSQERLRIFTDKNKITGYIDLDAPSGSKDYGKAGALEYGSKKAAKVPSHKMKLDHFWANKLARPITVMTKAYSRPMNIIAQAFERGPLARMRPKILERLNAVVEQAVQKADS